MISEMASFKLATHSGGEALEPRTKATFKAYEGIDVSSALATIILTEENALFLDSGIVASTLLKPLDLSTGAQLPVEELKTERSSSSPIKIIISISVNFRVSLEYSHTCCPWIWEETENEWKFAFFQYENPSIRAE